MSKSEYTVRVAHCDYRATEDEILGTLSRITSPLYRSWERIERARKIIIKVNMVFDPGLIRRFRGHHQELVDERVFRAVVRLLRQRTSAELIVADTSFAPAGSRPGPDVHFLSLLEEVGVEYFEASEPPLKTFEVPGGGYMFSRYKLSTCFDAANAVVSIAKMKSHSFMGVTLSLKNLFGYCPPPPHGRVRSYFHHFIRMPYVLADLGKLIDPALNIIDGLIGQSRKEWGGDARIANVLVAGDHTIATDACATWLMGHNPASDWPNAPFRRDRNPLLVAAEKDFGAVNLSQIDFSTEITRPIADFDPMQPESLDLVTNWRRSMCEQALFYRDHQRQLADKFVGQYIYLQNGKVLWHGDNPTHLGSRWEVGSQDSNAALYLKWADPKEEEGEQYKVYEAIRESLTR